MRTHGRTNFSGQAKVPIDRRSFSLIISFILIIGFPAVLSDQNAQDRIDLRASHTGSHFSFWEGYHEKLASRESYAVLHPQDANGQYEYGKLCVIGFNTDNRARDAFQKAIELKPDFAEAYNGLGWAYFDLWGMRASVTLSPPRPDVQHAIKTFELAIRRKPDYSDAYLGLGCGYMFMGRYPEAVGYLERVIKLNPNNAEAWDMLCGAYEEMAQYEKAIDAGLQNMRLVSDRGKETAIAYDHYLPKRQSDEYLDLGLLGLGRLYEKVQRYEEAIQVYEQAIERRPREPEGYHHLALAYFAKGDKASAISQYNRLRDLCVHSDPEKNCDHYAADLTNRIAE